MLTKSKLVESTADELREMLADVKRQLDAIHPLSFEYGELLLEKIAIEVEMEDRP